MRSAVAAIVVGLALLVGVPTAWLLGRPAATAGPPVEQVLAAGTPSPAPLALPSPDESPAGPAVTTRPAVPVPAAALPQPARLDVPELGISAAVDAVGVEPDGLMTIPEDVDRVGWYRFGPAPGSPAGSVVIAGHVDDARQGLGAMSALDGAEVGQQVTVTDAAGGTTAWRVVARQEVDKQVVPLTELFTRDGPARLVLITCGGPFLADIRSYADNVIVIAEPLPAG